MRTPFALAILISLMSVATCRAADTVETWGLGATNVDFYFGADGLGRPAHDSGVFGDIMLGYGLARGFSAYFGTTMESDRSLDAGRSHTYLGLFGTPRDGDHLDFDMFMDVAGGEGAMVFTPSVELNLDRDADQAAWGVFVRAGVEFAHCGEGDDCDIRSVSADFAVNPGAYLTLGDGSQLIVEYDSTYAANRTSPGHNWEHGAVALGWNVPVTPSIELINELHLDIPQESENLSWGVTVGVITTMPSHVR